jgi:glycosyltransferase involved in cell wall biosynthesis
VKREPQSKLRAGLNSLHSLRPFGVSLYVTDAVIAAFRQFIDGRKYGAIIFDHIYTADLKKHINTSGARIVINEHNTEYALFHEYAVNAKTLREKITMYIDSFLLKRFESHALRTADCAIHISEECIDRFSEDIRKRSVVIPNTLPYKLSYKAKTDRAKTVLFVGSMGHGANVEGLERFIKEAWVDIHALRPDIRLLIVGADPPPQIRQFSGSYNIHLLGYVENLTEVYEKATIAIAPLNIGSGGRLKILEAMMYSTLNITTPKGAEGLLVEHGKNIVIASDKKAWIDSLLFYLDHAGERAAIERNAHALAERLYCYDHYTQAVGTCVGG